MSIRTPPAKLTDPNIITLGTGALLHRVHDRNYDADGFNPCMVAPTRFAPIGDAKGNCVPSLYAADTLEAAIHETIFHDIPVVTDAKTVPRTLVQSRAHGQLEVLRDLRLASFAWTRPSAVAHQPKFIGRLRAERLPGDRPMGECHPPPIPERRRLGLDLKSMRSGYDVFVLRRPGLVEGFPGHIRSGRA